MHRVLAFFLIAICPAQAITLVDQGKSTYTIVVDSQASPSEQRAARELQRFLAEMSGAQLPIVNGTPPKSNLILLGASATLQKLDKKIPYDDLGPEGFVIRTIGDNLIITGGRQRGTMYGVYTFLDQLGCRWFTTEVSRIPKKPTIEIAETSQTHKPAFEYREPFFTEAWDLDWAARNRTNGDHTRLDATTGGKVQYYPFVHSFNELVPPDKYFKDHPEYFSLIDGKRRSERTQLCLTNPDVLKIAIAQVEQWIKDHPDATIFSVSQNDWEGWCECDRCRRVEQEEGGQHSGPVLRFVNSVATAIGKKHAGKVIDTLAYWYTENPPAKVRPVSNVRIRLCPIAICTAHSLATCPRSAYFYKNLQAWAKITDQLYIWHYNTNFRNYLMPFPDFDELAADIPLYKKNGVVGVFLQGAYPPGGGGESSELRAYVLARQLWDPATNVDAAVNEFLEGVYGPAAKPLRAYYDLLHKEVRPPAGRHLWIFNMPDYSNEFRTESVRLFEEAEKLAADDAARRRVQKARLPIDYYNLLQDSAYEVKDGFYTPSPLDMLTARAKDLYARMRTFGIQSIHEGVDLKVDEDRLVERKPLPVVTIESPTWKADVVPTLNARVVRLIEKSTKRDALRRYTPGDRNYPAIGGQLVTFHNDYHDKAWDIDWKVESDVRNEVVLIGKAANGATIRRTITVDTRMNTVISVENTGTTPIPVAIQIRTDYGLDHPDTAFMSFPTASGELYDRKFGQAGEPPNANETWNGDAGPAGEWRFERTGGLKALLTRFPDPSSVRTYADWTVKTPPGVAFGLWSKEQMLAPQATIMLSWTVRLSN